MGDLSQGKLHDVQGEAGGIVRRQGGGGGLDMQTASQLLHIL